MSGIVDTRVRPLAECAEADVVDYHAFVYGRVKIWTTNLTDNSGHEFTVENTKIATNGTRHCRECARLHDKKRGPRGSDHWKKVNIKRGRSHG